LTEVLRTRTRWTLIDLDRRDGSVSLDWRWVYIKVVLVVIMRRRRIMKLLIHYHSEVKHLRLVVA